MKFWQRHLGKGGTNWSTTVLRSVLLLFFLALSIPTAILVKQAYDQLKWEALYQYRNLAEELSSRINLRLSEVLVTEEARAFTDYSFLVLAGDPAANFTQLSPLASYPIEQNLPGLVGYFQIDSQGDFSTPLLPGMTANALDYGISPKQIAERAETQKHLQQILSENRLVAKKSADMQEEKMQVKDEAAVFTSEQNEDYDTDSLAEDSFSTSGSSKLRDVRERQASSIDDISPPSQEAFDRLKNSPEMQNKSKSNYQLGRVEDLALEPVFAEAVLAQKTAETKQDKMPSIKTPAPARTARKEQSALPQTAIVANAESELPMQASPRPPANELAGSAALYDARSVGIVASETTISKTGPAIKLFESEVDPFEFSLLDSGHFVLYRKVWRGGQRYIQGLIIEQQPLLEAMVDAEFRGTLLSSVSDLIVAYQGNVLSAFSGASARDYFTRSEDLRGELLYKAWLSMPLSEMELLFRVNQLPLGQGGKIVMWAAFVLVLVLFLGTLLMYRLGLRQISLVRQQQDFVSAVSHELKTPLTSIRMYGEILKAGWASEEKKQSYYAFIFDESERLSRLIANVLQLARMNHNELKVDTQAITVGELVSMVQSKISTQIESAGYQLHLECDDTARQATIKVDADYFVQIIINLVDNAIKFSANAERKVIEIKTRLQSRGGVIFSVRDYGPGIPKNQIKKIFRLFYRAESELTRETVGTGIGLALVQRLAHSMGGEVDVVNQQPGAMVSVSFPRK